MTQLINQSKADAGNRKSKEEQEPAKGQCAGTSLVSACLCQTCFLFLMREQMEFGQVLPEASRHWRDKCAGCSAHANASLNPSTTALHRLENHGFNVSFWMSLE